MMNNWTLIWSKSLKWTSQANRFMIVWTTSLNTKSRLLTWSSWSELIPNMKFTQATFPSPNKKSTSTVKLVSSRPYFNSENATFKSSSMDSRPKIKIVTSNQRNKIWHKKKHFLQKLREGPFCITYAHTFTSLAKSWDSPFIPNHWIKSVLGFGVICKAGTDWIRKENSAVLFGLFAQK